MEAEDDWNGQRWAARSLANALHCGSVEALQLVGVARLLAAQGRAQLAVLREGRVEVCCIRGGKWMQAPIAKHQLAARRLC